MTAANPLNVYDFFAGGAADERTLAENCRAFQRIAFRLHVWIGISVVDAATRVLERSLLVPAMLAPTALNQWVTGRSLVTPTCA
jgi:isopentenyl diphosphate isomerase/L-lactate dehydrogenase-like FMN-dependent dehydrogenase